MLNVYIDKITYTSLSVQAYYFHHLPQRLMLYTYSFQLDEYAHSVAPNHCCSQLHPTLDYAEQFDSVKDEKNKNKKQSTNIYLTKNQNSFEYKDQQTRLHCDELMCKKKTKKKCPNEYDIHDGHSWRVNS